MLDKLRNKNYFRSKEIIMTHMKKLICLVLMFSILSCGNNTSKETPTETKVESMVTDEAPEEVEEENEAEPDAETDAEVDAESEEDTEPEATEEAEETAMTPEQIAKAESIIASVDKAAIEAVDAKKLFRMHCAICHGFKGNMKVNGAKDLTKSTIDLKDAVAQVYFGKGLMTPYKDVLKEEEIVALSKYAETLR